MHAAYDATGESCTQRVVAVPGRNAFEGYVPSVPSGEKLDYGSDRSNELEERGASRNLPGHWQGCQSAWPRLRERPDTNRWPAIPDGHEKCDALDKKLLLASFARQTA